MNTANTLLQATNDINFNAGVRVIWNNGTTANAGTTLTVDAGNDINVLDDVIIEHTSTSNSDQNGNNLLGVGPANDAFINNTGGVVFIAGNDINIGDAGLAGALGAVRTGSVAVGSEFGSTTLTAGNDVNVTGGDSALSFSQIGYRQNEFRGNNSDPGTAAFSRTQDLIADDGVNTQNHHAANGDITVTATNGLVNVVGGIAEDAFAQIGHGGYRAGVNSRADIVSSDVTVTAGLGVLVNAGLDVPLLGVNETAYAQIGHGNHFTDVDSAFSSGNISGNLDVNSGGFVSVNLLTVGNAIPELDHDKFVAQIGHGSHFFYDGSGEAGREVYQGMISGDITIDAEGALSVGGPLVQLVTDDRQTIVSQIGHGAYTNFRYDGSDVSGDSTLSARYDRITNFNDIRGSEHGTNIDIEAGSISVDASILDSQPIGELTGDSFDALNRSQIGHGSFTRSGLRVLAPLSGGSTSNLDYVIEEGDISGDIDVLDTDSSLLSGGISVASNVLAAGLPGSIVQDNMAIARIGHGTGSFIETLDATAGLRGGDITLTQAHIVGGEINLETTGDEINLENISFAASVSAPAQQIVNNNTALALAGHGGDVIFQTGSGGASLVNEDADRGGDITINKGSVWDGFAHYDQGSSTPDDNREPEHVAVGGSTAIDIESSAQISFSGLVSTGGQATSNQNLANAQAGHGSYMMLRTGSGGGSLVSLGEAGGRGGDVSIVQNGAGEANFRETARDIDGNYGTGDVDGLDTQEVADGLRGAISLDANSTIVPLVNAISFTASNLTAGQSINNDNHAVAQAGSGDFIEIYSGAGGAGGSDPGEVGGSAFGGRGGHIDVQTGRIESDISVGTTLDPVQGSVSVFATNNVGGQSIAFRELAEAQIGHGQRIFTHSGDGGAGGIAVTLAGDGLANDVPVLNGAATLEAFMPTVAGHGAARGGNGGDIRVQIGDISDRRVNADDIVFHDAKADVTVVVENGDPTTSTDLSVSAVHVIGGQALATGEESYAGVGHHHRLNGLGGAGGAGGSTTTEHDGLIQPDSSGGRGGDIILGSANIRGDIFTDTERQTSVTTNLATGGQAVNLGAKMMAQIGHSTHLVAVSQAGGNAGNLYETTTIPNNAANEGGILDQDSGIDLYLVDRNGDDIVNLRDAGDSTDPDGIGNGFYDDGVAFKVDDDENDGQDSATLQSVTLGSIFSGVDTNTDDNVDAGGADVVGNQDLFVAGINPENSVSGSTADTDAGNDLTDALGQADNYFMINDGEGDPQFILVDTDLDHAGAPITGTPDYRWVPNVDENDPDLDGLSIAEQARNAQLAVARLDAANNGVGRQVTEYQSNVDDGGNIQFVLGSIGSDGIQTDGSVESGNFSVFGAYDAGQDADRDFVYVDLNEDGLSDLVDFQADGRFDLVDIDQNGIYDKIDGLSGVTELADGVIDYTKLTGVSFDASHAQGGWEVADFSTANGGRGGDATTMTGFTHGDITVGTGSPVLLSSDSLVVESNRVFGAQASNLNDFLSARVGHGAYQKSDTSALTGINGTTLLHSGLAGRGDTEFLLRTAVPLPSVLTDANGGNAGRYAVNASGGRGGDAIIIQGGLRDIDPGDEVGEIFLENDHLAGNISINPDDIVGTQFPDAKVVRVEALNGGGAQGSSSLGVHVAQIGHGSMTIASADNSGGNGMSHGNEVGPDDNTSITEVANGGRGGDASVTQHQVKGRVDVMAGADDVIGLGIPLDFSVVVGATNVGGSQVTHSNNVIIGQIGHGRIAEATSGNGGIGDDGQRYANGGRGGDISITQNAVTDTGIHVDTTTYDGNGVSVESTDAGLSSFGVIRSQIGHGDLAYAGTTNPIGIVTGGAGGAGANGLADPEPEAVEEQFNQEANGGRGGDRVISQAGYNYDIVVDAGPGLAGIGNAVQVRATPIDNSAPISPGSLSNNLILAGIGHGGYGLAVSNAGGTSGQGASLLQSANDGTNRNGGRGGHAVSNLGVGGSGVAITGREGYIGGINDADGLDFNGNSNDADGLGTGADIIVRAYDDRDATNDQDSADDAFVAAQDGIQVHSISSPLDNQLRSIDANLAIIGHHAFNKADADFANGGSSIVDSDLTSSTHTQGDGGDGGDAWASTGAVVGEILVSNNGDLDGNGVIENVNEDLNFNGVLDLGEDLDNDGVLDRGFEFGDATADVSNGITDANIEVTTLTATVGPGPGAGPTDQTESRIGHFAANEAMARNTGGRALDDATGTDAYNATVSANGGDGGDAMAIQGSLSGNIGAIAENSVIVASTKIQTTFSLQSENIAGIGHRLENDVRGGLGGVSSGNVLDMGIANAGTNVMVANDANLLNMIPNTTHNGIQFNGAKNILGGLAQDPVHAIYNALWKIKRDMASVDTTNDADDSNTFIEAYNDLTVAEQSLVEMLTGNPNGTDGDSAATNGVHNGNFLQETNNQGYYDDKSFDDLFDRVINGPRDQFGSEDTLTINEALDHDAGAHNTPGATPGVVGEDLNGNNILDHDVIPEMSVYEKEAILAVLSASGDGGQAVSNQGGVSGNINVRADATGLPGLTRPLNNGVIVSTLATGIAGGGTNVAQIGHGQTLIRAAAGDAGTVGDGTLDNSNGIGGTGGHVIIDQGAFAGSINLASGHEIIVESADAGIHAPVLGRSFVGHRQEIGAENELDHLAGLTQNRDGALAVVVAGDGGREAGNPEQTDGQNGNGGNITINLAGGSGSIAFSALNDQLLDLNSIRISASDIGTNPGEFEVQVGHDIHLDSAIAGDAAASVPHPLSIATGGNGRNGTPDNTPITGSDSERGLIGVLEGNGGDIAITQGDITGDIGITGRDGIEIRSEVLDASPGSARALVGHERTAGEDWGIGNLDELSENSLAGTIETRRFMGGILDRRGIRAGHGADAVPDTIDANLAGESLTTGDADGGNVDITLGKTTGDITITSNTGSITGSSFVTLGGDADTQIGHLETVVAASGEGAAHKEALNGTTAGDSGNITIGRGGIEGDITLRALDQDPTSKLIPGHQQITLTSDVLNAGSVATLVGHGSFADLETARAGFGGGFTVDYQSVLQSYIEGFTENGAFADPNADDYVAALGETISSPDAFVSQFGTINLGGDVVIEGRDPNLANLSTSEDALDAMEQVAASIRQALRYPEKMSVSSRANLVLALEQVNSAIETAETAKTRLYTSETTGPNAMISQQTYLAAIRDSAISAEDAYQDAVLAATGDGGPGTNLITDHADAGDIIHIGSGAILGDVLIESGRDLDPDGIGALLPDGVLDNDEFDMGIVDIISNGATAGLAETEVGHRQNLYNVTGIGGGEHDGPLYDDGTAGNGGDITVSNSVSGDITTRANTTRVYSNSAIAGTQTHLSHDVRVANVAGMSEVRSAIGEGGDISSIQSVSGDVNINTEKIASVIVARVPVTDSVIGATSAAGLAFTHLGIQAENLNHADTDPDDAPAGPHTGTLFTNSGGDIIANQTVNGSVNFNMDINEDGVINDLTVQALGAAGQVGVRLGHVAEQSATSGEVANDNGNALLDVFSVSSSITGSEINPTENTGINLHGGLSEDDGGDILATQTVGGDITFTAVEDLRIQSTGLGDADTFVGHDAANYAKSGLENAGPLGNIEDGGVVTANQTVTGDIPLLAARSIEVGVDSAAVIGEVHVGHEGTQTATSANDGDPTATGADDAAIGSSDGTSLTSPNPVDVDADQMINAAISMTAGEIIVRNDGATRSQVGHEAAHITMTDEFGHVLADSYIGNEITVNATGIDPGNTDTTISTAVNGDFSIENNFALGNAQVGHRSTSTLADGLLINAGSANTTQTINSDITVTTARDFLVRDNLAGTAQLGHFITEDGAIDNLVTPLQVVPTAAVHPAGHPTAAGENVSYDAVDTVEDEAFILPGASSALQLGAGDIRVNVGDNMVVAETGGRGQVGHRSPDDNQDQDNVTQQALAGDIIVYVGLDNNSSIRGDSSRPDGIVASAGMGGDDDLLIDGSAGGTARIGHNHATGTTPGVAGENVNQVSTGDIFVRVFGDMHVLGSGPASDGIGHEHYDFDGSPIASVGDGNATLDSMTRNRISGETSLAAGQNSPLEDTILTPDVMLFDNVGINSGYQDATFNSLAFNNIDLNQTDIDPNVDSVLNASGNELRFNIPAQENLTTATAFRFNDSHLAPLDDTGHTAVTPALRSGLADPIFIIDPITGAAVGAVGDLGANENFFSLQTNSPAAAFSQAYFNTPGNFAFYFGAPAPVSVPVTGRREVTPERPHFVEPTFFIPIDVDLLEWVDDLKQFHPNFFGLGVVGGNAGGVGASATGTGSGAEGSGTAAATAAFRAGGLLDLTNGEVQNPVFYMDSSGFFFKWDQEASDEEDIWDFTGESTKRD